MNIALVGAVADASSLVDMFAASDAQLKALAGNGNAKAVVEVANRQHAKWEKAQAPGPEVSASRPSIQSDAIGNNLNAYA